MKKAIFAYRQLRDLFDPSVRGNPYTAYERMPKRTFSSSYSLKGYYKPRLVLVA